MDESFHGPSAAGGGVADPMNLAHYNTHAPENLGDDPTWDTANAHRISGQQNRTGGSRKRTKKYTNKRKRKRQTRRKTFRKRK
jgi:hypothetical protein